MTSGQILKVWFDGVSAVESAMHGSKFQELTGYAQSHSTAPGNAPDFDEGVQSLKFAQRTKMIKNKAEKNIQRSPQEMEMMIRNLKQEV